MDLCKFSVTTLTAMYLVYRLKQGAIILLMSLPNETCGLFTNALLKSYGNIRIQDFQLDLNYH